MIRHAKPEDSLVISNIYNHYVLHTVVTFEEKPVTPDEMGRRMAIVQSKYPWLVWEEDGVVTGYAYATEWKTRTAYRYTVESTVYLHPEHTGKGIGRVLYAALIEELRAMQIHSVLGGIALPNEPSVKLHEGLGFNKAGQLPQVGWKFDKWVDVGYWVLLL